MESPVKSRLLKRATQRALIIWGGLALAVVVVLVLGTSFYQDYSVRSAEQARQQALAKAVDTGRQLGAVITPYRTTLQQLASLPQLRELIAAGDAGGLESFSAAHIADFPDALALRYLPPGTNDIDADASPPLTYASLDMLSKARASGETADAELHLVGSDNAHIVLVQPITSDDGEYLGALHLSIVPTLVNQLLTRVDAPQSYVEIRQPVQGAAPVVLIKSAGMAGEGEAALAGIPGSRWVLAIRPLARGSAGAGFSIPPALLGGAAILVLIAVGAVIWRRRSASASDAMPEIEYQGAIRSILDGAHPGLENLLPGAQGANRFIVDEPSFDITGGSELQAQEYEDAGIDLDLSATFVQPTAGPAPQPEEGIEVSEAEPQDLDALVPESIFRSYDIRGIVGSTLTDAGVFELGQALGSIGGDRGQQAFVVGRDGRHSSASLQDSLIAGLRASGRDVLDIGLTPTPVLYFATHHLDAHSGVMVTGSHNPPEYNGLKIVIDGETLSGDAIKAIRERVLAQEYSAGHGKLQDVEIVPEYIHRISEDIPVTLGNPLTVVVDCGNGVPGIVAPHILRAIGHDVIELFCEVDGNFPNHHPDPSQPENLASLIEAVRAEGADLGLAFDGDGDRLSVVDAEGNIVWPDQLMILFARDVLSRSPGAKVLYDVKCSGRLPQAITEAGGEAIMSRTGHSLIKAKLKETGALLAGEMSGHLFFNDRWYGFDDALYAAARLLEILVNADRTPTEVFAELPHGVSTPEIRIPLPETEHQAVMDQLIAAAGFSDATISTIDGLRVDFADSWGLLRPSNTTPCLTARFEGDTSQALAGVQAKFRELLKTAAPGVKIPF